MTPMNNAIVTCDRNYTRWLRSGNVTFILIDRAVVCENGAAFLSRCLDLPHLYVSGNEGCLEPDAAVGAFVIVTGHVDG
jgi:hypothetical protein